MSIKKDQEVLQKPKTIKTCDIFNNAKSKSDKYVNNDAEESNEYQSNYWCLDIVEKFLKFLIIQSLDQSDRKLHVIPEFY